MGLYKVHPPYSQHHPGPGFVPGLVRCQGPTVAPGCPRTPAHSCLQCLLFFPDPNRSFKDKHAGLDRTCHPCTSPLGRASFWSLPTEPATMHPVRKRTKGKKHALPSPAAPHDGLQELMGEVAKGGTVLEGGAGVARADRPDPSAASSSASVTCTPATTRYFK